MIDDKAAEALGDALRVNAALRILEYVCHERPHALTCLTTTGSLSMNDFRAAGAQQLSNGLAGNVGIVCLR